MATPAQSTTRDSYCRDSRYNGICFSEIIGFAVDTFKANKVRFLLTAIGMVMGTASLILVVTIGLTGKQYVLHQIQSVGANMVYVEYGGGRISPTLADLLTINDMRAVQQQVLGISAASPMIELRVPISLGSGKQREVMVLGVSPDYRHVRNLRILSGRFFDEQDSNSRSKVAVLQEKLAKQLYGTPDAAVGQVLRLNELPFVVIGTFKEGVETFGMSEIASDTVLLPYQVAQYFTNSNTVKQLFFSTNSSEDVPLVTSQIQKVIQSRHRPNSVYRTENLTQLLSIASRTANALTLTLLMVSLVTLLVSGVGIMNIMLATVSARVREIGIRKAVGATRREIKLQFLAEAVSISIIGGLVGIVLGLSLPVAVRWFTDYRIPISGLSAIIALVASSAVGIVFGTVPASRAAQLDPVESLHYE